MEPQDAGPLPAFKPLSSCFARALLLRLRAPSEGPTSARRTHSGTFELSYYCLYLVRAAPGGAAMLCAAMLAANAKGLEGLRGQHKEFVVSQYAPRQEPITAHAPWAACWHPKVLGVKLGCEPVVRQQAPAKPCCDARAVLRMAGSALCNAALQSACSATTSRACTTTPSQQHRPPGVHQRKPAAVHATLMSSTGRCTAQTASQPPISCCWCTAGSQLQLKACMPSPARWRQHIGTNQDSSSRCSSSAQPCSALGTRPAAPAAPAARAGAGGAGGVP